MADKVAHAKAPRRKSDRKTVVWVAVIGMAVLVVYLFASQGPDLGQGKVNAERKTQQAAAVAKRYQEKVPNPEHSTAKQLQEAQEAVQAAHAADTKKTDQRIAHLRETLAPPSSVGFPPPSEASDAQLARLSRARKAAGQDAGPDGSGAVSSSRPSFVMFQVHPKGGSMDVLHSVHVKMHNESGAPASAASAGSTAAIEAPGMKAAYARLAALQKRQQAAHKLALAKAQQISVPGGESNLSWLYQAGNNKVQLASPTVAVRSKAKYWLAPGTIVHAVIQDAMNTRLPGVITARVTQAVYDSRYGRYLVIPAGSVLKGRYNTHVEDGQNRVMLGFDTLITPAGGMVDLGSLAGADGLGRSGVHGKLHTHFWKRMGIAGLMAVEAVGMDRLDNRQRVVTAGGEGGQAPYSSGGQILVNAANQELKQRMPSGPNITVPAGAVVTVTLTHGVDVPPVANSR